MTTSIYIQCFIAGIMGILFHVFILKLPALKKRSRAANKPFSFSEYLQDDWLALVASVISVLIVILVLDEVVRFKPQVLNYLKFFFVFVGYTGSSTLQAALGVTEKAIMKVVDRKTDIADGVEKE